jgi:hypothetical protein
MDWCQWRRARWSLSFDAPPAGIDGDRHRRFEKNEKA